MKTRFLLSAIAVLLLGLSSCNHSLNNSNKTPNSSEVPSSSTPIPSLPDITSTQNQTTSSNNDNDENDDVLSSIAFAESPFVGNILNLIAKNKDGTDLKDQNMVTYKATKGEEFISIAGNKVKLLNPGEVTIRGSYKGVSTETSFVIVLKDISDDLLSIADAKKKSLESLVSIKGKVLYAKGTEAYIADETSGVFVKNWIFDSTDTGFDGNSWKKGDFVQIKGKLRESKEESTLKQLEITNSEEGKRVDGTYAKKTEANIKPIEPKPLDESSFKKLTNLDSGNLYTFKAQYISGDFTPNSSSHLRFILDYEQIFIDIAVSDNSEVSKIKFSSDSMYEITAPVYWSNGARFAFLDGVSKLSFSDKNKLSVTLSDKPIVTSTISFIASFDGVTLEEEDQKTLVKYNYIEKKGTLDKVENRVTLKSPGEVIMSASYYANGITNRCAFIFNIEDVVDVTPIKDISSNGPYLIKAQVVALTTKGFMVSDGTGTIYVEKGKKPTVKIGDYVSIKGSSFRMDNQAWQFTEIANVNVEKEGTAVKPQVNELTPTIADSFVSKAFETSDIKLYAWEATAITNVSFTTLNLEGSKTIFKPLDLNKKLFPLESGKRYKIEAYVNGYYSDDNYSPIVLTKASEIQ